MIIERIKDLYKHSCLNCQYLEMYLEGHNKIFYFCPFSGAYYNTPHEENECECFKQDKIAKNQQYLARWKK